MMSDAWRATDASTAIRLPITAWSAGAARSITDSPTARTGPRRTGPLTPRSPGAAGRASLARAGWVTSAWACPPGGAGAVAMSASTPTVAAAAAPAKPSRWRGRARASTLRSQGSAVPRRTGISTQR